jgi:hypothetical protein
MIVSSPSGACAYGGYRAQHSIFSSLLLKQNVEGERRQLAPSLDTRVPSDDEVPQLAQEMRPAHISDPIPECSVFSTLLVGMPEIPGQMYC